MTHYELPANATDDVLRLKIDEVQDNLQSVDMSNCIVADPASLLSLLSRLPDLQSLSCVACPLKPHVLLGHLLTSLQKVSHLRLSFMEDKRDAMEELLKIPRFSFQHGNKQTQIRKLYAEVADHENMIVLSSFLQYCPCVQDLQVHFQQHASPPIDVTAEALFERLRTLEELTITCEVQSSQPSEVLDLPSCRDMQANAVFRKSPTRFNYADLYELAHSPSPLLPHAPVVLLVADGEDLQLSLGAASLSTEWKDLRSLCILHLSHDVDQTAYPVISATYDAAFRDFFDRLSNLVELNVNSVHFGDDADLTKLLNVAAKMQLRALSLAPCGLPKRSAVRMLALALVSIDDLDVRLNRDGRHSSCEYCDRALLVNPADVNGFGTRRSGRLTLSNVPNLVSLDFLGSCPMPDLRFIDVSDQPRFDFKALAQAVRHNDALRSLVVKLPDIDFDIESLKECLPPARALERLCLLSRTKLDTSTAETTVEALAGLLPSIFYVHIHYVDEAHAESAVTWIRLSEGDAEDVPRRGKVIAKKPCIMCSTQTFIALAKPRYRVL
ncbi:hypothetical protein HPB50_014457 [Hyalomma asiaticum]|uniref:Uncharacterized protein n=1 Tax=Hyalomma asiaticum TaxID=266040 RepID=A0ACB7T214_HYAAI|nr:hypothetical protein HPB50_014457 [Hyalomma asiaticum]